MPEDFFHLRCRDVEEMSAFSVPYDLHAVLLVGGVEFNVCGCLSVEKKLSIHFNYARLNGALPS